MPLFYEITAPNGKKNHLFGTFHSHDVEINTFPLEVKQAFQNAKVLWVECDLSAENMRKSVVLSKQRWQEKHALVHQQWASCSDNVDEAVRLITPHFSWYVPQLLIRLLVTKLPPMHVFYCIRNPEYTKQTFLDQNLVYCAKKNKQSVGYLESVASQLDILLATDLSYKDQRELFNLKMKFFSYEQSMKINKKIKQRYLDDNMDNASGGHLLKALKRHSLPQLYHQMKIAERDKKMVSRLEASFLEGNAFVAVGAAHLARIAKAYQQKGYAVKAIPMGKRIFPVLNFYERQYYNLMHIGLLLFDASVWMAIGLTTGSMGLSFGLLSVGVVFAVAMLIKISALVSDYIKELSILKPISTPSVLRQTTASSISMFNQEKVVRGADEGVSMSLKCMGV